MKMGDQEPSGSSSNRNGRHPKKPKPKKVPQRGLGVAQLEKIRLEEEVKNDTENLQSLAITSHPFPQHNRPYPFSDDNPYGHVPCNPHLNLGHHSIRTVSATPLNNDNNFLRSANIHQVDKSARFPQNLNPPYEPIVLTSPVGVVLLGNQQSSSISSLMMNDGAENSSSAVLSSQTEPPSNQSPYGTYQSVQPDEAEKMVGMKRPCPFSTLQDPSKKLLHCKFNPFSIQSNSGPFRDGMPHSNSSSDLLYTKYNRAEYMTTSDGDFLKLASPVTMSLFPNSKSEQAQSYYLHNHQAELLKHKSTSPSVVYPLGLGSQEQEQQQSFFAFLPEQNITQDGRSSVTTSHPTDDQDQECLDLSLKL